MSPILVRPVREQLEHDRIIRLLQLKYKRKHDARINPGAERTAPVGTGLQAIYPDVLLYSLERGRRLEAVIEVETGESVNHLEALSEWVQLGRLRAALHLYVPSHMVDVARRLCSDNKITVAEIWSYHSFGDEIRFTLVQKSRSPKPSQRTRKAAPAGKTTRKPAPKTAIRKTATRKAAAAAKRPVRRAKPARAKAGKKAARKRK